MADEEHKPGEMDITEQQKTFDGFIKWTVNIGIVCILIVIFLAISRTMKRRMNGLAALAMVALLAGCAAEEVWAPDVVVSQSTYRPAGAPTVTLVTMVSNSNGSGGHSALIIDGSERVVFDPAGSWYHPQVPERNDVLYGMSPLFMDYYMDYHARETYHVVLQEVDVSPATAASLISAVQSYGAVPSSQCSLSISRVLSGTSGFEAVRSSWFPLRVMDDFAALPGVRTSQIFDDDSDDNLELLQAQGRAAADLALATEVLGN